MQESLSRSEDMANSRTASSQLSEEGWAILRHAVQLLMLVDRLSRAWKRNRKLALFVAHHNVHVPFLCYLRCLSQSSGRIQA